MDQSVLSESPDDTYVRLRQQVTDRGPWQQTFSGTAFFLGDPRPEEVHIADVAHALSYQCRYNGHARKFYSIAQHAVLVSLWMEEDAHPLHWCYAGLHHDSAEAYTGDVVSQVKFLVPQFKDLERAVEAAVKDALRVPSAPKIDSTVKAYDLQALATEKRDLLSANRSACTWGDMPSPRFGWIRPWNPQVAETKFLARHYNLVERMNSEDRH